ncbi:MAG: hypothetical protein AB7S26_06045 [Sandaracinaceae bacterium]
MTLALAIGCASLEPLPSLYDDATLAQQIRDGDGMDARITRYNGFVHGDPVGYWTIGINGAHAMPIYQLCRAEGSDPCVPIDHPPILDALPGDAEYTPYGQVHWVRLPEGWDGRLASREEIDAEVARLGIDPPSPSSELHHCPITVPETEIELGEDMVGTPAGTIYYRGREARCFDFGANPNRAVLPNGDLFIRNVYVLTREGEDMPLMEAARMMDITGDGDAVDSNNTFGVGLGDGDYTPLWRMVAVTVPASYSSIDTSMNQELADYRDAHDMFDVSADYMITPRMGQIVDYTETETLINCPLQSAIGQL